MIKQKGAQLSFPSIMYNIGNVDNEGLRRKRKFPFHHKSSGYCVPLIQHNILPFPELGP